MTTRRDARRSRPGGRGVAALLALALLAGCVSPAVKEVTSAPGDLPPAANIAGVPFYPQGDKYCGPAALAMVLGWSGLSVTPEQLVHSTFTPLREGTLKSDILTAARRHGRLAVQLSRLHDLLGELSAGHPVLVFQNLGLDVAPQWHFAVATGYDLAKGEITLHSGADRDRRTSLNTFAHVWARGGNWAVTVTPPGVLPARAEEVPVLRAAIGLERAGLAAEAASAYRAVLNRWPKSFGASMGLGNARYATKDFNGAVEAFSRATALRPMSAAAWNNLAHAIAATGDRAKAIAAARRAIQFGGTDNPTYRATLVEVSHRGR